jgi:hypothetical protein
VRHTEQRGIWVPTQHLLWDQGKPRKTELTHEDSLDAEPRHRPHRKRGPLPSNGRHLVCSARVTAFARIPSRASLSSGLR